MARRSSPRPILELSISQLVVALGLNRATLMKRLHEADTGWRPGPRGAKLYRIQDVIHACKQDFFQSEPPGTYDEARTREMKARAMIQELDLAQRQAELLPAEEVGKVWAQYIAKANIRLGAIASSLAPLLVAMTDEAEIKALIDAAIDEARIELAGDADDEEDAEPGGDELEADAAADGEPVGGPAPAAEPRGERRPGPLEHDP